MKYVSLLLYIDTSRILRLLHENVETWNVNVNAEYDVDMHKSRQP